jgi:uncharacterized protein (TIGR02217 family)
MSFLEVRLLDEMAYGFSGGPTWRTDVVQLRSGIERRNQVRIRPLHKFSGSFDSREQAVLDELIAAFNACAGMAFGFRFKDWMDFEAQDVRVGFGTGAAQVIQLAKPYVFGPRTTYVPIRKPNADHSITANGVPIAHTVDTTTGLLTLTAPAASVIRWTGTFDRPMRFSSDDFSGTINTYGSHTISANLTEDMSQ